MNIFFIGIPYKIIAVPGTGTCCVALLMPGPASMPPERTPSASRSRSFISLKETVSREMNTKIILYQHPVPVHAVLRYLCKQILKKLFTEFDYFILRSAGQHPEAEGPAGAAQGQADGPPREAG